MELNNSIKPYIAHSDMYQDGNTITFNHPKTRQIVEVINQPTKIIELIQQMSLDELIPVYDELESICISRGTLFLIEQSIKNFVHPREDPFYIEAYSSAAGTIKFLFDRKLSELKVDDRFSALIYRESLYVNKPETLSHQILSIKKEDGNYIFNIKNGKWTGETIIVYDQYGKIKLLRYGSYQAAVVVCN